MSRSRKSRTRQDESYWIGYTDLLSNSLMILLLAVAVTAVARATNEKPPLLRLTEEESFRFGSGSYTLSTEFLTSLDRRIPEIRETIDKYRIDSIEIIGHTDGQPSPGMSNLDVLLPRSTKVPALRGYLPGSNIDLGLLRAVSVANYLRTKLDPAGNRRLVIRPYSAGSLIGNDGDYSPADTQNRPDRRRIEVRFTRKEQS